MKKLKCYEISYQVCILDDLGYWKNRKDLNQFSIAEVETEIKRLYEPRIRRYMTYAVALDKNKHISIRKNDLNILTVNFYYDGTPGLYMVASTLDVMDKVKGIMLESLNWAIKCKEEILNGLIKLRDDFYNEYKPVVDNDKFEETVRWDNPNPSKFEVGEDFTCYQISYSCYINDLLTQLGYQSTIEQKNKIRVFKASDKVTEKWNPHTRQKEPYFRASDDGRWITASKDELNTFKTEFDTYTDIPYVNGCYSSPDGFEKAKQVVYNAFTEAIRRVETKLNRLLEKKKLYLEEQGMEDVEYKDYPKGYHFAFPSVIKLNDKGLDKRIYEE